MRIRIDTSREALLNIPRGVLALGLVLFGIAAGYILPALLSVPMRSFAHEFAALVIASVIALIMAIAFMRGLKETRVNLKIMALGLIIGALFSLFFWGAQLTKTRMYKNRRDRSQQSDRESTSKTAPEGAVPEASHP